MRRFRRISLSTDIIVGFHGEEEADFRATLELMAAVRYDSAFSFKYSLRENTRAFRLGDTVSEEEKGRRLAEVIALQERVSAERNRALVGERSQCWSRVRRAGAAGCSPGKPRNSRPRYFRRPIR